MSHWLVDVTNELRAAEAVLDRLRLDARGTPDYSPLLTASGSVGCRLIKYREHLSELCAPWFEVRQ